MLDSLVKSTKQNNERLASIEKSVNALVMFQKKELAAQKLERRRADNLARREKSRARQSPATAVRRSTEKKQEKNFLQKMMDGIGTLVTAKAFVVALGVGLAGAAVVALKDDRFRAALKEAAIEMGKVIKDFILSALGLSTGSGYTNQQVQSAKTDPTTTKEEIKDLEKLDELLAEKLHRERAYYKFKDNARKAEKEGDEAGIKRNEREAEIAKERVDALLEEIKTYEKIAKEKGITNEQSFRIRTAAEALEGMAWYEKAVRGYDPQGLQTGGSVRVPGSGNGDTVPAIVPAGSFVMNKIASSAMGYQAGGIPVMLEPGEQVFGPGSWGPAEFAMNSIIPRFQKGGQVDIKQIKGTSRTGGGWQPDSLTDYKGEPIVASKAAAEAIMKMYGAGLFRGEDVNSSQRSKSYNASLQGASATSNHLTGNALDVQTGSPTWHALKTQGSSYGWNFNDYLGPQGWHFDFVGGNDGRQGAETKVGKDIAGMPNAKNDLLSTGTQKGPASKVLDSALGLAGAFLNKMGAGIQEGLRAAGLPGMADYLHMIGEGFRQSKIGSQLMGVMQAIPSFFSGFGDGFMGEANATETAGQTPGKVQAGPVSPERQAAYDKILGIAKKVGGAKFPSVVAATAMHESNYLGDEGIYKASGYTNPFGQSGKGDRGSFHYGNKEWAIYSSVEAAVKDHIRLWHDTGNHAQNWNAHGSIADGIKAIVPAYSPDSDPMNQARGFTESGYGNRLNQILTNQGHDIHAQKKQLGGVVNMRGGTTPNMQRYKEAMEMFQGSMASRSQPIIVPMPMPMGGGGGGGVNIQQGTPTPPSLPEGPQVVALLELQNRLALGAAL